MFEFWHVTAFNNITFVGLFLVCSLSFVVFMFVLFHVTFSHSSKVWSLGSLDDLYSLLRTIAFNSLFHHGDHLIHEINFTLMYE
jgi:hypothetical protein